MRRKVRKLLRLTKKNEGYSLLASHFSLGRDMGKKDRLYDLMGQLDDGELLFLLRNGLGRTERKYKYYTRERLTDIISAELRQAAGHSAANFLRLEHEFPYRQILLDVADRLGEGYRPARYDLADRSEEEIEEEILRLFELKIRQWWNRLKDSEKERFADQMRQTVNAETVNFVSRRAYIRHRVIKELKDSVITKGIVLGMLAVSAGGFLGFLGGSLLTAVGFRIIVGTAGLASGIRLLTNGIAGFGGVSVATFIGTIAVGIGIFLPSTLYFYADTNYKKTIPTVVMLLSRVHLNKILKSEK